ncbi:MAG: FAD-binding oxidoreductase [Deltaproteobacteria bacterium]|nr:FAD-binding oxidoreductase [Deltaproteobacteria bacterium]
MPLRIITDRDILAAYETDESGLHGHAAGLVRPATAEEVARLVRRCRKTRTRLLPVGRRTATTGAAVPQGDLVLSTEKLTGVVGIDRKSLVAEVLPGTLTADVKRAVEAEGLYYPPDPTSENECTLGGNIATNASGARSFRWGMTRDWVDGIEVVLGTGERLTLMQSRPDKNTAGYAPFQDPVSLFLSSEGTLGVITRAWLRLIPDPGPFVAFLAFFPELSDAFDLAVAFRSRTVQGRPRCVELFDRTALDILSQHSRPPAIPAGAQAALFLEFDTLGRPVDRVIDEELGPLERFHVLLDDTVVADRLQDRTWLRELRHSIPEWLHSQARSCHAQGGLKVSTEFCVPPHHLHEIMHFVEESATQAGAHTLLRYGHIGNAHPHVGLLGRNPDEVARMKRLVHLWYARMAGLGGTVSGEHGIGKTRRDILRHQYPPMIIRAMREVKRVLDPDDILAIGNIYPETPAMLPEFFS